MMLFIWCFQSFNIKFYLGRKRSNLFLNVHECSYLLHVSNHLTVFVLFSVGIIYNILFEFKIAFIWSRRLLYTCKYLDILIWLCCTPIYCTSILVALWYCMIHLNRRPDLCLSPHPSLRPSWCQLLHLSQHLSLHHNWLRSRHCHLHLNQRSHNPKPTLSYIRL